MEVELKIDVNQHNPKVIIVADKITDEIKQLMNQLAAEKPRVILGIKDGKSILIKPDDIVKIYSANQKVFVVTQNEEYWVKYRLYEFEELLSADKFIRISISEIVNIDKIESFDFSLSGTICIKFTNGKTTFVSRRYVTNIKKSLGL